MCLFACANLSYSNHRYFSAFLPLPYHNIKLSLVPIISLLITSHPIGLWTISTIRFSKVLNFNQNAWIKGKTVPSQHSHLDKVSHRTRGDHDVLWGVDILQWNLPADSTCDWSSSQCDPSGYRLSSARQRFSKPHLLLWVVVPRNYRSRSDGE